MYYAHVNFDQSNPPTLRKMIDAVEDELLDMPIVIDGLGRGLRLKEFGCRTEDGATVEVVFEVEREIC